MQKPIRIEAADGDERTQIGDALAKFARKGGHLETGRAEGTFFVSHGGGCDVGGEPIRESDTFYLDPETGEVLCERHGDARRRER
ncbi:hypothetical protein BRC81_11400 [Halobacteriales archaeon QS_1_68_20]|nr:MAG: hypothetical protein BRC81_11400 [Halobacteriales archaeon QS_1_68_20]